MQLKEFFAEFEKAISQNNFEKIGELFGDSFISAGPNGYTARTRGEFLAQARAASAFYQSIGQTSLKIASMDEKPIGAYYSSPSAGERRFAPRAKGSSS
jgi:hypothetical protein